MLQFLRPRAGRGTASEDGIALLASVAITGLASILLMTMLGLVIRETRQTGRERTRSSAVTSAEGATDVALNKLQNADVGTVPCGPTTVTNTQAKPDTLTITTTVKYYTPAGVEIPCPLPATTLAAQALVKSTSLATPRGGGQQVSRTVETLVSLKPTFANDLNKAIFGNSGVVLNNRSEIFGSTAAPDADVYTNGSFSCTNNERFHGSVYAQGSISLSNTCQIDVNAWAKTGFSSTDTRATVLGDVYVSRGNADISSGMVGGKVKAVTITPASFCTANPGKCVTGTNVVADPPMQTFPQLNWDSTVQAAWVAEGYTNVVTVNDCTDKREGNGPAQWAIDNGPSLTQPTILRTTCAANFFKGGSTLALGDNLAIFADGGLSFRNSITITSTNTTVRNLYMIQPYNAVAQPCTTTGIDLGNQVTITSTVSELLYSPCNVTKANNTDHYGQIYAGGIATIDNALTMYYRPLPVWGVSNSNTVKSYAADVLYKREQRS